MEEESSHFTSVLRIVACANATPSNELSPEAGYVVSSREDGKSVVVTQQPHQPSDQSVFLKFDRIYPSSASFDEVYKDSVAGVVDSMLVGYHSTVISVGPPSFLTGRPKGLILAAAKHIFRMLKKSNMTSSLSVLCSYVIVSEESVYDLLYPIAQQVRCGPKENVETTNREAKRFKEIATMLQEGEACKKRHVTTVVNHSIFTIRIEHARFGSMISPVSGNLSFVDLGNIDAFENTTTKSRAHQSLQGFVSVIHSLTSGCNEDLTGSTLGSDEVGTSDGHLVDFEQSVLTRLLREALGGNCKTLLISQVVEQIPASSYNACSAAMRVGSIARHIVNHPDKTELAKRALMDAYMKELKRMYSSGHVVSTAAGAQHPQLTTDNRKNREEEEAAMAAKALATAVQAVKEGNEDESGDSDYEEDYDDDVFSQSASSDEFLKSMRRESRKKIKLTNKMKKKHGSRTSKYSLSEFKEFADGQPLIEETAEDLTIDALVAVIQDPDNGVPRPRTNLLTDVKFHRGKGDVFSGSDIVHWMVQNIVGIENEQDGETLGQILLDKGALFHSEGSSVFANAESLFYYARDPRSGRKALTLEEIQALFARNRELTAPNTNTNQQTSSKAKEYMVESKSCQNEKELKDPKCEEVSSIMVDTSAGISRAANPSSSAAITMLSPDEIPTSQDLQAKDISSLKHNPHSFGMHMSAKFKLAPLPVHQHLSIKEDGPVTSLSAEFDPNSPLPKIPNDATGKAQATEVIAPQSVDEHRFPGEDAPFEATTPIGVTSGGTSLDGHSKEYKKVHVNDAQPKVLIPLAHELHVGQDDTSYDHVSPEKQTPVTPEAVTPVADGAPNISDISKVPTIAILERYTDYPHPLHFAAAIGKEAGVIKNLVNWYGVNVKDEKHRTPLMFAALGNKASVARALLECGAKIDCQEESGLTALHIACYHGSKDVVTVLISNRANITITDKMQHSAFHWATVPETTTCLKALLRISGQGLLEQEDMSGLTPIHWSIYYNHSEHLRICVTRFPEMKKTDSSDRTLLTYAIQRNSVQCVEVLLKYLPELVTTSDMNGLMPLHHASAQDDSIITEILLKVSVNAKASQKINVNEQDYFDRTPLHYAVLYNRLQTAELLLMQGADKNLQEKNGMTPLQFAQNWPGVHVSSDMASLLKCWKPSTQKTELKSGSPISTSTRSEVCTVL